MVPTYKQTKTRNSLLHIKKFKKDKFISIFAKNKLQKNITKTLREDNMKL